MPVVYMVGPKFGKMKPEALAKFKADKAAIEKSASRKAEEEQKFYGPGGTFDQADLDCDGRINCEELKCMTEILCKDSM